MAASDHFDGINQSILLELKTQAEQESGNEHPATRLLVSQSEAGNIAGDWASLNGFSERMTWLSKRLFPSRKYMEARYKVHFPPLLWGCYLWRIVRGSVRLFTR